MKRSKMVKLLADAYWKHMNCGPECCVDDVAMYSNILKMLEQAGMRPPLSTDVYEDLGGYTQYGLVDKGWEDET